jgi:hypothetical protein
VPKLRVPALVLCLAALAVAPAQASAATETVTSGPVTATFTYAQDADNNYTDLHLKIERAGVVGHDQAVESIDCSNLCWPGSGGDDPSVKVLDLDVDGEPEVVLDLFTGGAHCCLVAQVFAYAPPVGGTPAGYGKVERNFADPAYTLKAPGRDGFAEFRTVDYRFLYSLASYAGSAAPPQVFRFRQGEFVDVTLEYPSLIRADSKRQWRRYRKHIRSRAPQNDPGLGALAAWAGDEYLLGHGARVQRELRAALKRGWLNGGFTSGRQTIRALNKLLRDAGYR